MCQVFVHACVTRDGHCRSRRCKNLHRRLQASISESTNASFTHPNVNKTHMYTYQRPKQYHASCWTAAATARFFAAAYGGGATETLLGCRSWYSRPESRNMRPCTKIQPSITPFQVQIWIFTNTLVDILSLPARTALPFSWQETRRKNGLSLKRKGSYDCRERPRGPQKFSPLYLSRETNSTLWTQSPCGARLAHYSMTRPWSHLILALWS